MDQRRVQRIGRRTVGSLWVTALSFLALAFPAHAAVGSERGALVIQITAASVAGALFGLRSVLKRSGGRMAASLTRARDRGVSLAAIPSDAAEHAGTSS